MKKMLFVSALAAVTMLSCSKSNEENGPANPTNDDPVPVRFSQSIEAVVNQAPQASSKAVTTDKLVSEDFVVYAVEHTGTVTWAADNFMNGTMLTTSADGTITYKNEATDTKYYSNASSTKYQFYAIHPSTVSIAPAEASKAPVVTIPASTDLLVASQPDVAKSTTAVALAFTHKMAQLKIEIVTANKPNPELEIASVAVEAKTGGTLSLGETVQPTADAATEQEFVTNSPLKISTATTTTVGTLILTPGQSIKDVKIKIGSAVDYTTVTTSSITLEEGKTSTITLTIKDQDISFSHSIAGWGTSGNNGSGTVTM